MFKNLKANKMLNSFLTKTKRNTKIEKFKSLNIFKKFATFLLLVVCAILILNPKIYAASCLNAISVWAVKVLPALFPFFIFSKIIVGLIEPKQTKLDKLFAKIYHTPATSSSVYLLSILSGYPMGAKLICNMFERGVYTREDAKKMLAFCSVSGPMFMIGTVGVAIFGSFKAGVIIFIANLVASLINGLIFRGKKTEFVVPQLETKQQEHSSILADSVYDALISILLVGSFMVLAFLIVDILKNTKILAFVANLLCKPFGFKHESVQAVLAGLVEITRGIIDLNLVDCSLQIKVILASGLIGFGGICIMLQSITFLKKLNIKFGFVLLQKFVQGVLASIIAIPLSFCVF